MRRKRVKELSQREWNACLLNLADNYLRIRKCKLCKHPALEGYVCHFCGRDDSAPENESEGDV